MRNQLEPDWETAEKLYPIIKALIEEYTEYCDKNGDEDFVKYKMLESKLSEMTQKDISQYNLWEWWEEEGLEVLSFRISLPEPNIVEDISKKELLEIIQRIQMEVQDTTENSFKKDFLYYLADYYHKCLEQNFKNYDFDYFIRQKGKDGKYFEYPSKEIAKMIWHK